MLPPHFGSESKAKFVFFHDAVPQFRGSDCSHGPWEGQRVCNYDFERVRFATAEKVCEAKGLEICPQKLENYGCSYNDIHVWTQEQ